MGNDLATMTRLVAMTRLVVGIGLTLAAALGTAGCGDNDETTDGLTVSAAWARPTPGGATAGAVYVTVTSESDDSIISASVPEEVAADAQMHESATAPESGAAESTEGGTETEGGMAGEMMMTMREVDSVDLVAGEPFEFASGATHIMLFDLAQPLTLGQEFTVELQLASGSSVAVEVVVADTAPAE